MLETINSVIAAISDVLYQPWFVPLFLIVSGIYFTFRCRFIQIRLFKDACKVIMEKPESEGSISSFGALMISTASRVGTGNIIGVSTAICLGGPGAIFWMWVTALLGGATAFIESTLAQIYKKRAPDGSCYGGPAYYMRDALGKRWMGVIFSVLIILIYAVGYNMLAAYNLQSTFSVFKFYHPVITPAFIGVILAFLFGVMVLGGAKRLASITEILVPFMGILYVLVSLLIIFLNIRNVPGMFASIFRNAFDFQSVMGGFSGSCIMYGVKRGLYSNSRYGLCTECSRNRICFPSGQAGSGADAVRIHRHAAHLYGNGVHVSVHQRCSDRGNRRCGLCTECYRIYARYGRSGVPCCGDDAVRVHHAARQLLILRGLSGVHPASQHQKA